MAALAKHGVFKTGPLLSPKNVFVYRLYATKAEKKKGLDRKVTPKIVSSAQSIAAKGFLRAQRAYIPPSNLDQSLNAAFETVLGPSHSDDTEIKDLDKRFKLLKECARRLDHSVTNSMLHTLETLSDVRKFYSTPVDTTTPLDRLQSMELPENLHVQVDYHRFHPDTDTMFGGVTAFPQSSTLVTGLKYKEKYKGHSQKSPWPDVE